MSPRRECPAGHAFFKTSDCPTCAKCEAAKKPAAGFLAGLAAPARRALTGADLTTLARLARCSEAEARALHGMGPNALAKLKAALAESGRKFSRGRS